MWIFIDRLRIIMVFEPIMEKFCVRKYFIESVAVRIPTRAMIPKEMIRIVRIVRNKWLLMDTSEIFIFSTTSVFFIDQGFLP